MLLQAVRILLTLTGMVCARKLTVCLIHVYNYTLQATMLEHAPLEAVYIYFNTATYDEIGRDEKVR